MAEYRFADTDKMIIKETAPKNLFPVPHYSDYKKDKVGSELEKIF